jgi:uncharacterized protein (DUF305 family)
VSIKNYLLASVLVISLTACSGNSSESATNQSASQLPSDSASVNEKAINLDDATWLAMMLAHHQQAVDLSDLPLEQTNNQEIKDLATQIRGAQYPEMEYMNGLLYEAGYLEPIDVQDHLTHMQGMLSSTEFDDLAQLRGAEFDQAFLAAMISHHEGAIDMCTTMLATGTSMTVKELAQKIIDAQTVEISQMKVMLADLS